MSRVIQEIESAMLKKDVPQFSVGDNVKVFSRIIEGGKERLHGFEGVVIKRQGHGVRENFTVRKMVQGVGVERTFILHSPRLEKVEVIRKGKVRRAKLYYLRKRVGGQATKIEESKATKEGVPGGEG